MKLYSWNINIAWHSRLNTELYLHDIIDTKRFTKMV